MTLNISTPYKFLSVKVNELIIHLVSAFSIVTFQPTLGPIKHFILIYKLNVNYSKVLSLHC